MRLRILTTLMCLLMASTAAATLSVSSNHPTSSPIGIAPGGTAAIGTGIVNLDSPDGHSSNGGRLVLQIQPIGGATGSVSFINTGTSVPYDASSAYSPVDFGSFGGPIYPQFPTPQDMNFLFIGADAAVGASDPLANVGYMASAGASGDFGLFLVYDGSTTSTAIQETSHWDGIGTSGLSTANNVFSDMFTPGTAGLAQIGLITVVPEPSSFALMGLIGLVFAGKLTAKWLGKRED